MERERFQSERLLPETRRLIEWVETSTGRPIVVEPDPAIRARGRAIYVVSDRDPRRHLVKYDPMHESTRDALIAHECGHIAMLSEAGPDAALPVVTERSRRRALAQLEGELADLEARGLPLSLIAEVFPTWLGGTVSQLVDTPADMSIESWLWYEWPGLREIQGASLRDQARTYAASLNERVRRLTPTTVWRASVRMNGRLAEAFARLLGDERLVAPWRRAGLREPGLGYDGLLDLQASHAITTVWQSEFGLDGWFEWKPLSEIQEVVG